MSQGVSPLHHGESQPLVVAITGASGTVYAKTLLHVFSKIGLAVLVVASKSGRLVYGLEMGRSLEEDLPPGIALFNEDDFTAPFASGSFLTRGMVIIPCSMGTLASVANGISTNLIHRAADVCLKEHRNLVLVPRETPLSSIHLSNMLKLAQAGAIILPAMPGFYHRPKSIDDLVNFMVARVLDQFGISQDLVQPWGLNKT